MESWAFLNFFPPSPRRVGGGHVVLCHQCKQLHSTLLSQLVKCRWDQVSTKPAKVPRRSMFWAHPACQALCPTYPSVLSSVLWWDFIAPRNHWVSLLTCSRTSYVLASQFHDVPAGCEGRQTAPHLKGDMEGTALITHMDRPTSHLTLPVTKLWPELPDDGGTLPSIL